MTNLERFSLWGWIGTIGLHVGVEMHEVVLIILASLVASGIHRALAGASE